jgi:hypothetical protein
VTGTAVTLSVLHGDITTFDADVVVLKHAQRFYGADAAVARALERAGIDAGDLAVPAGEHRLVATRGALAAGHALFVAVPPLWAFSYPQIDTFAAEALAILKAEARQVTHAAMTIHGVGYGLDEIEALVSQCSGLARAVGSRRVPPALERVSIVDIDSDRADRLCAGAVRWAQEVQLGGVQVTPTHRGFRLQHGTPTMPDVPAAPATQPGGKPHIVVVMPDSHDAEDAFHYGVQPAVRDGGYLCEHVRSQPEGEALAYVWHRIDDAAAAVVDITEPSPWVYLLLGYAWGRNRQTILVSRGSAAPPALARETLLVYRSIRELELGLRERLTGALT